MLLPEDVTSVVIRALCEIPDIEEGDGERLNYRMRRSNCSQLLIGNEKASRKARCNDEADRRGGHAYPLLARSCPPLA